MSQDKLIVGFNPKTGEYEARRGRVVLKHSSSLDKVKQYIRSAALSPANNKLRRVYQAPCFNKSDAEILEERAMANRGVE